MEKALRLTKDLIERRDQVMMLYRDYPERVAPWREWLRTRVALEKRPIAEVALDLAKRIEAAGHDPNLLFAALVEECEAQNRA